MKVATKKYRKKRKIKTERIETESNLVSTSIDALRKSSSLYLLLYIYGFATQSKILRFYPFGICPILHCVHLLRIAICVR